MPHTRSDTQLQLHAHTLYTAVCLALLPQDPTVCVQRELSQRARALCTRLKRQGACG